MMRYKSHQNSKPALVLAAFTSTKSTSRGQAFLPLGLVAIEVRHPDKSHRAVTRCKQIQAQGLEDEVRHSGSVWHAISHQCSDDAAIRDPRDPSSTQRRRVRDPRDLSSVQRRRSYMFATHAISHQCSDDAAICSRPTRALVNAATTQLYVRDPSAAQSLRPKLNGVPIRYTNH